MFLPEDKCHMLDLKGCFPKWAIWLLQGVHPVDGGGNKSNHIKSSSFVWNRPCSRNLESGSENIIFCNWLFGFISTSVTPGQCKGQWMVQRSALCTQCKNQEKNHVCMKVIFGEYRKTWDRCSFRHSETHLPPWHSEILPYRCFPAVLPLI